MTTVQSSPGCDKPQGQLPQGPRTVITKENKTLFLLRFPEQKPGIQREFICPYLENKEELQPHIPGSCSLCCGLTP